MAQFSPGDLSKAHAALEGMNNCAKCHEVGKEISGSKCLDCHAAIKKSIEQRHGFHFAQSASRCTVCHKEHLGRTARITLFDSTSFDHGKTGFVLAGKHATLRCAQCHTAAHIRDTDVMRIMKETNRETFLGLSYACSGCHEDRHQGTVGTDCQSCHTDRGWKPAAKFDHKRTKFPLVGLHAPVACTKCHTQTPEGSLTHTFALVTNDVTDCAPCHTSPHRPQFSTKPCSSCHTPAGWREPGKGKFDHSVTAFPLKGRHAVVRCEQCHTKAARRVLKPSHERCTDCHSDYHKGEFTQKYRNDCVACHTEEGFKPSTFSFARHSGTQFALKGAHAAIPCARCHRPAASDRAVFRITDTRCTACHTDRHGGQFADVMGDQSCAKCHSTDEWKLPSYDHAAFPLTGKHASAKCSDCHKAEKGVVRFRGTAKTCEACHADAHRKQFAADGSTDCSRCHAPNGWRMLVFDHNTQTIFPLTGAHKSVSCLSCHRSETAGNAHFIRYKPVSTLCESCHTKN